MNNHHKLSALFVFALGFGCAGAAQQEGDNKPKEPALVTTKQKIVNMSAVDLAGCFPKAPPIASKLNSQVLTGLLISARTLVMECLVDPKNRGTADDTQFTLETTVDGGKFSHAFDGTNLTDPGKQCIGSVVEKYLATSPDWAAKAGEAKGVKAKAPFQHSATNMASVRFGVSEASDVTGTIRLAQAGFCDCYAGWRDAEPVTLKASVKLKKGAPAAVTFEPTTDATGTQVAACLQPKVAALPLKQPEGELTLPYTFAFTSTMRDALFASAAPDVAFAQYDGVRNQHFAATIIADGARVAAAEADTLAVQAYQKRLAELPAVQATCADLMKAHEGYLAALEKEIALEEKGLAMITDFAAKDASWGPVKDVAVKQLEGTKKDLEAAKGVRKDDEAMCAKRNPAAPAKKK